jgi:hypothetical protein
MQTGCRYTVVTIEIILRDGRCVVRCSAEARNVSILHSDTLAHGPTQPRIQWVIGLLATGIKQSGRECDHLPPSYALARPLYLRGVDRASFTLTYYFSEYH